MLDKTFEMVGAVVLLIFVVALGFILLNSKISPIANNALSYGDCGKTEGMCVPSGMFVDYALPYNCPNSYFKSLGSAYREQTQCGVINSCSDVSDDGEERLNFKGTSNKCIGYSKTCTKADGCCCVLAVDCSSSSNGVCSSIKESK